MTSNTFPQYRKLNNNKNFYKIISEVEFEEVTIIGAKALVSKVLAEQYPEKLRIQDMLSCEMLGIEVISHEHYQEVLQSFES